MPDSTAFRIQPDALYHDGDIVLALGVTHAALALARRQGRLRFAKIGQRIVYRGDWLTDWLDHEAGLRREVSRHA